MSYKTLITALREDGRPIPKPSEYNKAIVERSNEHAWIRELVWIHDPNITGAFLCALLVEARRNEED